MSHTINRNTGNGLKVEHIGSELSVEDARANLNAGLAMTQGAGGQVFEYKARQKQKPRDTADHLA